MSAEKHQAAMTAASEHRTGALSWGRFAWGLSLAWTALVGLSLYWNLHNERGQIIEMVRAQARTAYEKDIIYRFWNTEHAGVYVPVSEITPPNPYLADIPERDIVTPSGRELTLMNPAYMTRQAHEVGRLMLGVYAHLTSLKPIRPENAPDPWEARALKEFERGAAEVSSIETLNGEKQMRLMRPLYVEKECLRCHAKQGYKEEEIRGGISISVPMKSSEALLWTSTVRLTAGHLLLWAIGLVAIFMRSVGISRREAQRQAYEAALKQAMNSLEIRVQERTVDLARLNEELEKDIAMRRETEQALQKSENRLAEAQKIAHIGSWEWNIKDRTLYWSDEMYRILGWEPGGITASFEAYAERIPPEERDGIMKLVERALEDQTPYEVDHRLVLGDGSERIVHAEVGFHRHEQGQPTSVMGTTQDITERVRKAEEVSLLESQLRQSQKMESIGTLAGGIAHDFNNILTPILGYTQIALACLPAESPASMPIRNIGKAAQRARNLVRQILTFSRRSEQEKQAVRLQDVVEETLQLLRPTLPSTIEICTDIQANCSPIWADPSQMHQVIMNLCTNAYHAMLMQGGALGVSLFEVRLPMASKANLPNLPPGPYILLEIRDSGHGMDEATRERIFDPFFTTKPAGMGTGLGLSVVHGIVRSHGGTILVKSAPGQGSIFSLFFPVYVEVKNEHPAGSIEQLKGRERLLLVDDETDITEMFKGALESLGYAVTVFSKSQDALSAFAQNPGAYDLVIADQIMPDLTGTNLSQEMLLRRPELPILLLTGHGEGVQTEKVKAMGIRELLFKPLDGPELARWIRHVLDSRITAGK